MAQTEKNTEAVPLILSLEESYEYFDREVRRLMNGMSGEEFMDRWEAGEFYEIADTAGNRHIMRLGLMMPRVKPESR